MKDWYALYVKPRAEKKVSFLLSQKDVAHYIPIRRTLRQWSDRKKWVDMPAISGYVFINITPKTRLSVLQTDFVICFVRYLGKDAVIPESQINRMKQILGQSEYNVEIDQYSFEPGQLVKVIEGPLTGLTGCLCFVKNRTKLAIRFEEVNINLLVEIPAAHVATIENRPLNN